MAILNQSKKLEYRGQSPSNLRFRRLPAKVTRPLLCLPECSLLQTFSRELMLQAEIGDPAPAGESIHKNAQEIDNLSSFLKITLMNRGLVPKTTEKTALLPKGAPNPEMEKIPSTFRKISEVLLQDNYKENLFTMATQTKESSLLLQRFLEKGNRKEALQIGQALLPKFERLIPHRQGSYVLHVLVATDESFRQEIVRICTEHFMDYAQNEYSSRLLQSLAAASHEFLFFATAFFHSNFEAVVESKLGYHLVIACIGQTTRIEDFGFIFENFLRNPEIARKKKNLKRIIASYLTKCPAEQIEPIADVLRSTQDFLTHLNTKTGALLLMVLIKRGHQGTAEAFLDLLSTYPRSIFKSIYFKRFVGSLWREGNGEVNRHIGRVLANMDGFNLYFLKREVPLFLYYLYLAIEFGASDPTLSLSEFLGRDDLKPYIQVIFQVLGQK